LYGMNYNPPYYQKLFENYGFKSFFHQYCYALYVNAELQSKLYDRHAKFAKDPNYRCEHIDKKKLEKYATDFCTVYNKAWAGHGGNKTMGIRQAKMLFKSMKPVIDERIVWFIYHKEEPIGFWLNLPDLNQWFKYLNGKFGLWQKLHFLWLKKTKKNKRFVGIVFGVVPEFQKRSEEHTSELQSRFDLVCRLLLEKKQQNHPGQAVVFRGPALSEGDQRNSVCHAP